MIHIYICVPADSYHEVYTTYKKQCLGTNVRETNQNCATEKDNICVYIERDTLYMIHLHYTTLHYIALQPNITKHYIKQKSLHEYIYIHICMYFIGIGKLAILICQCPDIRCGFALALPGAIKLRSKVGQTKCQELGGSKPPQNDALEQKENKYMLQ